MWFKRLNAVPTIEVFFDGECSDCRREIGWLQGKNRAEQSKFIDIAARDFRSNSCKKSLEELMSELHVPEFLGTWFRGVDALRQLYSSLGMGWLACCAVNRRVGFRDWIPNAGSQSTASASTKRKTACQGGRENPWSRNQV
jgi:predicted DCC family thiol-disulfide oxidoreductase YuxK